MASKLRKKLTEAEKVTKEATTSVGTLETEKEELEMKIKQLESEKQDLEKEKADLETEKQVQIKIVYLEVGLQFKMHQLYFLESSFLNATNISPHAS